MAFHPNTAAPGDVSAYDRMLYTLTRASSVLDLSIATLRRREKEGRFKFVKVGYRTMMRAEDVHALARGDAA